MTRTHAALRLLEHGPLTMAEFLDITGWTWNSARSVLARLMEYGKVCACEVSPHRCVYGLTQ